jgi:PAS domain S-box-containing protein
VRRSGIEVVSEVPWGTHFCQFYETSQDLIETLVPYFREGLMANEFCMWVTSAPLQVEQAKSALGAAVPNLDHCFNNGQIEILDSSQWYIRSGKFSPDEVLQGWVDKLTAALERGYEGLRLTGNTFWLAEAQWDDFTKYEEAINNVIGRYRMLAICIYSLQKCGAMEIIDVVANHQFALIKRQGQWEIIESFKHKKMEQALRASEQRFRSAVESFPFGLAIYDAQRRYLYINHWGLRATGLTWEQMAGRTDEELFPPEVTQAYSPILQRVLEMGRPESFDWEMPARLGGRTVIVSYVPLLDGEGKVYQVLAALQDITSRKRTEQALAERTAQLERTKRELVALNAELDDFTNVASHDLQEPLRILTAFSDLLPQDLGGSLPKRAAQDLRFITDAAKRMQTLIQDLLALSRAGRIIKKSEKVSLDECADRALEVLSMRVKEKGAQITRDKLPEVWGDSTLLTQLYQNLIGNALKFSGDQSPVIRLTTEEREGLPVFGVKDNGIGIESRYAQQIFQPFRRLHGRGHFEGSGIGLAICRKIVERHGGKIWVESEPGKGSHFRFTLSHRRRE